MTEPSGTDRGAAEPWWQRGEERLESAVGGQARLRVVLVLACVLALNSADLATVGAVAPQLQQSLGIGNIGVGILVSTSTGIGALATIPAGMVIDRSPRVRLLAGAVAVWSIAMIVSGAASSFLMLLLTRLALGAIVATAFPAVASLAGDLFPSAERGRLFGYVLSGELIGVAIGFLISGTLASVSWRLSFWVLAVPGLVFAVALPRLLPEPARGGASRLPPGAGTIHSAGELSWLPPERRPNAETGSGEQGDVAALVERDGVAPHEDLLVRSNPNSWSLREAIRYVLSIPTNRMLIVASALGYFYFAGLRTFAVEYLRNRFDLGQAVASVLLVVLGAGAILGVLLAGRFADRLLARGRVSGRMLVAGSAFALTAVMIVPTAGLRPLALAAPLLFLVAAGLGGSNPPLDAARLDIMIAPLWGRAESVRTALRSLFVAAAPLLFGLVSVAFAGGGSPFNSTGGTGAAGLNLTFLVMAVSLVLAAVILLIPARKAYPADVATAAAAEHESAA